jgi:hypothetical protein
MSAQRLYATQKNVSKIWNVELSTARRYTTGLYQFDMFSMITEGVWIPPNTRPAPIEEQPLDAMRGLHAIACERAKYRAQ